jgi:hypothetical protein
MTLTLDDLDLDDLDLENLDQTVRPLDDIADEISKLECSNIFDIGRLLNEANEQCGHGEWTSWLTNNIGLSWSTAYNYMNAADLVDRFPTVGKLKLCARTIYALAEVSEEHLPGIIEELAKHATKTRLSVAEADKIIRQHCMKNKAERLKEAQAKAATRPTLTHRNFCGV